MAVTVQPYHCDGPTDRCGRTDVGAGFELQDIAGELVRPIHAGLACLSQTGPSLCSDTAAASCSTLIAFVITHPFHRTWLID